MSQGRNKGMQKNDLVFIVLISVIAVIIASFMIPLIIKAPHSGTGQVPNQLQKSQPVQQSPPPPGQEENKQLKTAISFINIGLIIPLFIIYAGIYRNLRSSFTLGLMAVIFALGMYAITSNPLIVSLLGGRTGDIGIFQIIPDLCATAALVILVRISLE
jgi:tellurite resistance protein TehA-like permease